MASCGRRAIGGHLQHLRRRPRGVRCASRLVPARGPEPRVEVLLQGAQVPALELARPVRAVEEGLPGAVAPHLRDGAARLLDAQREEEAGLPQRPRALAVTVEEDLDTDHVRPGLEPPREVHGVGLVRPGVARGGAPLHAAAVHEEPVAAVRRDPASSRGHLPRQLDLAAEEDEGVREGALAGQPDPAGRCEVEASAGLGRGPRPLRRADRRRRGPAHGGLRGRRRRRGRLRLPRRRRGRALLARLLRRLGGAGRHGDRRRDRRAQPPQEGPPPRTPHQRPPGRSWLSGG